MRLASRVEPPFSGKNASGSVCAQSARSCHSGASPTTRSVITSAATAVPPPLVRRPRGWRVEPPVEGDIDYPHWELHACNAGRVKRHFDLICAFLSRVSLGEGTHPAKKGRTGAQWEHC